MWNECDSLLDTALILHSEDYAAAVAYLRREYVVDEQLSSVDESSWANNRQPIRDSVRDG